MMTRAFAAAQQTLRLINRKVELERLKKAICEPGQDTRLLIIKAPGGLGKTRLLLEAVWRAGHTNIFPQRGPVGPDYDWRVQQQIIISGIMDFSESRLHIFDKFTEQLRQSFDWHPQAEFPKYDSALSTYRRRSKDHVDFSAIKMAADQAHTAFFEDYQRLTQDYRLVWVLDTLEQLRYPGALWLKEKNLLTSEDLNFSTRERLLSLLAQNRLPNTTIVLAGRPSAAEYFKELIKAAGNHCTVEDPIDLTVFSPEDTKNYLLQLEQDYTRDPGRPDFNPDVAEALAAMATLEAGPEGETAKVDQDRITVLHQFTGGKPVLLALFTDLIVEGKQEPEALRLTPAEAQRRLQTEALTDIQFDIEAEFIKLIFAQTGDLRSRILVALVRARRGLGLDQLEFILGSAPGQDPAEWAGDKELRRKIEAELDEQNPFSLRYLSFVKSGLGGRLILQDELYRIYDEHMAREPHSRQDETNARATLYRQLHALAKTQINRLKAERNKQHRKDEDTLVWASPARALTNTFRYVGQVEEDKLIDLEEQILEAELERIHYKLRLNPDEGIFDWYVDPSEQRAQTVGLDRELQSQIELWRFAQYNPAEEHWRNFINTPEQNWPRLERVIAADDVTRWIKQFFNRNHYERAVAFIDQVETAIPTLSEPARSILSHPFFKDERISWKEFTQTYLSQDVEDNIKNLQDVIQKTSTLLRENFAETNQFGLNPDTAQIRLRRILGVTYNNLGYSYTVLGEYRAAVQAYTRALRYLQDTGFFSMQANIRNNLSRALSELGLITRAERICRDGLTLREELGHEAPIAWSHSTLALIYNNGMRPENAWVEAATAVAYFRKLLLDRGHGLALYQLAESLRRLATSPHKKQDTPEQLFETAMEAIDKAVEIFSDSPEKLRLIEMNIEQGCLYRDYMHYLKQQKQAHYGDYINKAVKPLNRAREQAKKLGYPRHQLDALVDLAWAYYYAGDFSAAQTAFQDSLNLAATLQQANCFLVKGQTPPKPTATEPYVFMLLGKLWAVQGRMHMDRFGERREEIRKMQPDDRAARIAAVHQDNIAQQALQAAAEAFVLALGYNELYSTRSPYLPIIFDMLYDYLKSFNATELQDFYHYQDQARKEYRVTEIVPEDVTDIETFLLQSFGDYFETAPEGNTPEA